jgi:hypothetical protein
MPTSYAGGCESVRRPRWLPCRVGRRARQAGGEKPKAGPAWCAFAAYRASAAQRYAGRARLPNVQAEGGRASCEYEIAAATPTITLSPAPSRSRGGSRAATGSAPYRMNSRRSISIFGFLPRHRRSLRSQVAIFCSGLCRLLSLTQRRRTRAAQPDLCDHLLTGYGGLRRDVP